MAKVLLRPARKSDCADIAALYRISSDGVADYIWTGLAEPGEEILEVGKRRYEREDTAFSYQNCSIAEQDGRVLGMLSAFPLYVDPDEKILDPILVPYANLEEDASFYICGVALYPEFRGQGIGKRFMQLAEDKAREHGLSKLSLIVFEENSGAKSLYERLGYLEVGREAIVPHPLIHFSGDALLMVKKLD